MAKARVFDPIIERRVRASQTASNRPRSESSVIAIAMGDRALTGVIVSDT